MSPADIYRRARALGLHIEADGKDLLFWPKSKFPPELVAELSRNKAEILSWLAGPKDPVALGKYPPGTFDDVVADWPTGRTRRADRGGAVSLTPDQTPWVHVARQVLAGEFGLGMTDSMRKSLTIGLRSIPHPLCRQALAALAGRG